MLVWGTHARQTPRNDLAALSHELSEQAVIFVVDVGNFLGAELADFFAPEKFARAAFSRRSAGARTASAASEPGTISARSWAIWPGGPVRDRRCCFGFFSHNAP